jgi:hypothetical protein
MKVRRFPELNQNHLFTPSFSYNVLISKSREKSVCGKKYADSKIIIQLTELPQRWNRMNIVMNFQVT